MAGPQSALIPAVNPSLTPAVAEDPGAPAELIHGGPASPEHGNWEWDNPVPWAAQQGLDLAGQDPTAEGSLIGAVPPNAPPGTDLDAYADPTATLSHGAPWPADHTMGAVNDRDATAVQAEANRAAHSIDSGGPAAFTQQLQGAPASKMPWENSPDYVSAGNPASVPVGGLTGNNRTGWDRYAGWAVPGDNLNRYGFDSAHVTRFTPAGPAHVPVPDDQTMGVQRPLVMNIPGRYGHQYPTGPGSPFAGQLAGTGYDIGAGEIGVPSDYVPPPDPLTNPPLAEASPAAAPAPWGWSGLGY
jgi:hypothetical protein